jgi:hypothetical protein
MTFKKIYAHADSAAERAQGFHRDDETLISTNGDGNYASCLDVVSEATREEDRMPLRKLASCSWRETVYARVNHATTEYSRRDFFAVY